MKIQIREYLGEGGSQAGDNELVLGFEVATVSPVPQDSEHILPGRMQIEVAALSRTIGLKAPEVVAAVDARASQSANEWDQFLWMVCVSRNPNSETFLPFSYQTFITAVDEPLRQGGARKNYFVPSRHSFPEPIGKSRPMGGQL
jgi:hypothetical protein